MRRYHPSTRRLIDIPAASRLWQFGFTKRQIAVILSSMYPGQPQFHRNSLDQIMWRHRDLFPHRRAARDERMLALVEARDPGISERTQRALGL